MADKKLTVVFKSGDQHEGDGGFVFFRDENGEITALFEKSVVAEWPEG